MKRIFFVIFLSTIIFFLKKPTSSFAMFSCNAPGSKCVNVSNVPSNLITVGNPCYNVESNSALYVRNYHYGHDTTFGGVESCGAPFFGNSVCCDPNPTCQGSNISCTPSCDAPSKVQKYNTPPVEGYCSNSSNFCCYTPPVTTCSSLNGACTGTLFTRPGFGSTPSCGSNTHLSAGDANCASTNSTNPVCCSYPTCASQGGSCTGVATRGGSVSCGSNTRKTAGDPDCLKNGSAPYCCSNPPDPCANTTSNNITCISGKLYDCVNKKTVPGSSPTSCSNGCKVCPPFVDDVCSNDTCGGSGGTGGTGGGANPTSTPKPTATPKPTPADTGTPAPTTTITPTITLTPSPTISGTPTQPNIAMVSLQLDSIDTQDQKTSRVPRHNQRKVTLYLYKDANFANDPLGVHATKKIAGTVFFSKGDPQNIASYGVFTGQTNGTSFDFSTVVPMDYYVFAKTEGSLRMSLNEVPAKTTIDISKGVNLDFTNGFTRSFPMGELIGNDNQLTIADFNAIVTCYNFPNAKSKSADCQNLPGVFDSIFASTPIVDLNDDGRIDGIDLNIFLRNYRNGATGN